jgi:uncharacterized MnhB-related membrane protein
VFRRPDSWWIVLFALFAAVWGVSEIRGGDLWVGLYFTCLALLLLLAEVTATRGSVLQRLYGGVLVASAVPLFAYAASEVPDAPDLAILDAVLGLAVALFGVHALRESFRERRQEESAAT